MSQNYLSEALNNSIERLTQGDTIENCLRDYPDIASELHSLLETGMAVHLNRAESDELNQMRDRMDAHIEQIIAETDFDKPSPFHLSQGIAVLIASLVFVFAGILFALSNQPNPDGLQSGITETPTITETATASPSMTASHTQTDSPTATPTETATPTAIPTETATPTVTVVASDIPANNAIHESTKMPRCVIPDDWFAYRVKNGDTLSHIAVNSGVSIDVLREVNCLSNSSFIIEGQVLYVPRLWDDMTVDATDDSGDNSGQSENIDNYSGNDGDDDHDDEDDHEEEEEDDHEEEDD